MDIFKDLTSNSRTAHWREAFFWFCFSVIGGLFPLLATAFVLVIASQQIHLRTFTENGEFALYAAVYVSGGLYIVVRDFKKPFPSRVLIVLLLVVLLLVSALLFVSITLIKLLGSAGLPQVLKLLNQDMVAEISLILLPVTFALSIIITVAENTRTDPDLLAAKSKQLSDLESKFDNLGGE